jgi:hypothetical protein
MAQASFPGERIRVGIRDLFRLGEISGQAAQRACIRNRAPEPRRQRWSEGEVVRLVKTAWRKGYRGLACIIAVAWDTQFSRVDVRTLARRHCAAHSGRRVFDRQDDGRTKTGRAAIGTVSTRTERLVVEYLDQLGIDLHPDAILFRNRSGNAYRADTLSDDFADLRELAFPGDKRRLMDMRRSGVVEAIAGEAGPLGLSAKLANSIDHSNALHKTYAPVDIEAVLNADAARLKGRQKCALRTKAGKKYQLASQSAYQLTEAALAKYLRSLATPAGFEPATFSLEGCCSIP